MKAYLKYELLSNFGVIASNAGVLLVEGGKLAVTAALECVAVWNLRQGALVRHHLLILRTRQFCSLHHSSAKLMFLVAATL